LQQLEKQNKGILFICDKNLAIDWQSFLSNKFNAKFIEFKHLPASVRFTFGNQYHPISSQLKNIQQAEINDFWQIKGATDVLLETGDYPIALEKDDICLWLFDPSSLQNPFLLDASYPVFAYKCLKYLSDSDLLVQNLTVGSNIKADDIRLPNGNEITLGSKKYVATQAGNYKANDKTYPVNLDYKESNYSRLENINTKNLEILAADWQENILHSRYGFEIWKYLLVAVLLLFALEMIIVKRAERK
jgi:hypothetical protein